MPTRGFTRASLEALMPILETNVGLIEQPVKVGHEAELDGLHSPIPLAADESAGLTDIEKAKGRFDVVVNIKPTNVVG